MDAAQAYEAAKLGIWTFLATEVLLFGGLFTAYIVFRIKFPQMFHADHFHLNRILGAVNTIVLICSSLTVALGIEAIRKGKQGLLKLCLSLTILLAAVFLGIKYVEWTEKFAHGLFPGTDVFFSLYFMMTGLHGLHVLAGMLVVAIIVGVIESSMATDDRVSSSSINAKRMGVWMTMWRTSIFLDRSSISWRLVSSTLVKSRTLLPAPVRSENLSSNPQRESLKRSWGVVISLSSLSALSHMEASSS